MIALLLAAAIQLPPGLPPARRLIGIFHGWGAYREAAPRHCFAIAEPAPPRTAGHPFASIATWPALGARNQLHVRLSQERSPRARVTLTIDERRFELVAGPRDAWASDATGDRAIVAAMRSGRAMSVESVSVTGRPFADSYALAGAATAIDAAALGCAPRG